MGHTNFPSITLWPMRFKGYVPYMFFPWDMVGSCLCVRSMCSMLSFEFEGSYQHAHVEIHYQCRTLSSIMVKRLWILSPRILCVLQTFHVYITNLMVIFIDRVATYIIGRVNWQNKVGHMHGQVHNSITLQSLSESDLKLFTNLWILWRIKS
jgi:hypothetical protein